jgi:adenylosuccinate synthase
MKRLGWFLIRLLKSVNHVERIARLATSSLDVLTLHILGVSILL